MVIDNNASDGKCFIKIFAASIHQNQTEDFDKNKIEKSQKWNKLSLPREEQNGWMDGEIELKSNNTNIKGRKIPFRMTISVQRDWLKASSYHWYSFLASHAYAEKALHAWKRL